MGVESAAAALGSMRNEGGISSSSYVSVRRLRQKKVRHQPRSGFFVSPLCGIAAFSSVDVGTFKFGPGGLSEPGT